MAYSQDLLGSARRHLRAAQELNDSKGPGAQPGCTSVAGYLFGLAGELAIKEMMRASGMRPKDQREDDPYYHHFPDLKSLLLESAQGRLAQKLRFIAGDPQLFQYWDIAMRYAPTSETKSEWVEKWRKSAEKLVAEMDL